MRRRIASCAVRLRLVGVEGLADARENEGIVSQRCATSSACSSAVAAAAASASAAASAVRCEPICDIVRTSYGSASAASATPHASRSCSRTRASSRSESAESSFVTDASTPFGRGARGQRRYTWSSVDARWVRRSRSSLGGARRRAARPVWRPALTIACAPITRVDTLCRHDAAIATTAGIPSRSSAATRIIAPPPPPAPAAPAAAATRPSVAPPSAAAATASEAAARRRASPPGP